MQLFSGSSGVSLTASKSSGSGRILPCSSRSYLVGILLSLLPLFRLAEADDIALDGRLARRSWSSLARYINRCPAPRLPFLHRTCFALAWPCCPVSRSWRTGAASTISMQFGSQPSPEDGLDFLGHRLSPVDRTTFCYTTPKGGGAIQAASRPQEMRAFVCSRPVHW